MHHEKYHEAKKHFDSCVEYSLMDGSIIYPALNLIDVILDMPIGYKFPLGYLFECACIAPSDHDSVMSCIPYITGDALNIANLRMGDNFGNMLTPSEIKEILDADDKNLLSTTYTWIERTN